MTDLITHNIDGVIRHLKGFRDGIPGVMSGAIAPTGPGKWTEWFGMVAEKTLRAMVHTELRSERNSIERHDHLVRLSNDLLKSLKGEVIEGGALYRMGYAAEHSSIGPSVAHARSLQEENADPNRKFGTVKKRADMESRENVNLVREGILDFVRTAKHLTEVDNGQTDEEIADRLEWILGIHDRLQPKNWTEGMKAGTEGLARAIQDFLNLWNAERMGRARPGLNEEDAAIVRQWLEAVQLAWRSALQARMPVRVGLMLEALWTRTRTDLL